MPGETLLGVASALKTPLDDLYNNAKGGVAKKLKRWKADKNVNNLYKKIYSVQKVKTIWQIDKAVNLKEFYYPSKILTEDKKRRVIYSLGSLPYDGNVVIEGVVGQGKSIFLRYLTSQELRRGHYIPLFFELRRVPANAPLKEELISALINLGFSADSDLFDYLASSGRLVLFLDGFDEVREAEVGRLIHEIETLSERFEKLRVIVTSRPDSGIQQSPHFHVCHLAPLEDNDLPKIIKKLLPDQNQREILLSSLEDAPTRVKEVLTTPLMATLLVFVFKAEQKVPDHFVDFFGNLFSILFSRHDKTKPGFVRERYCQLNQSAMRKTFDAFCFLARKKDKVSLTEEEAIDWASTSLETLNLDEEPEKFIRDITKITCLVAEEGTNYHFIHKSVQEFHASSFLAGRPDNVIKNFYTSMANSERWSHWREELNFLAQLDRYRYTRDFLIPAYRNCLFFNRSGVERSRIEEWIGIIKFDTKLVVDSSNITVLGYGFHEKSNDEFNRWAGSEFAHDCCIRLLNAIQKTIEGLEGAKKHNFRRKLESMFNNRRKKEKKEKNSYRMVPTMAVIEELSLDETVRSICQAAFAQHLEHLHAAERYVKNEEQLVKLIDI